jgi:hypothetical protein
MYEALRDVGNLSEYDYIPVRKRIKGWDNKKGEPFFFHHKS